MRVLRLLGQRIFGSRGRQCWRVFRGRREGLRAVRAGRPKEEGLLVLCLALRLGDRSLTASLSNQYAFIFSRFEVVLIFVRKGIFDEFCFS